MTDVLVQVRSETGCSYAPNGIVTWGNLYICSLPEFAASISKLTNVLETLAV